jgi:hypothetical protein
MTTKHNTPTSPPQKSEEGYTRTTSSPSTIKMMFWAMLVVLDIVQEINKHLFKYFAKDC